MVCKSQCSDYTIEDFYDLVFPPELEVDGYLGMIFTSFLDDSKDANQSKMFVSAGFLGDKDDWGSLRAQWDRVLRESEIEYFKSSEYNHLDGEFARFRTAAYPPPSGRNAAKEIKDRLQQLVKNHPSIRGVGVFVIVEDFNKVCARPETTGVFPPNPYHRALESVMFHTVKIISKIPGRNQVAFVHDEESDFAVLYQLYLEFKRLNPRTAKRMASFTPLSDKRHPPLQVADMIANNTLEVGMDYLAKGKPDEAKIAMKENISLLGYWDEHYMLSILKGNLLRLGRPIPLDLDIEEYG